MRHGCRVPAFGFGQSARVGIGGDPHPDVIVMIGEWTSGTATGP